LEKNIIINKIKFIADLPKHKKIALSNVPYIIFRWPLIEPRLKFIHKYKIHPLYSFSFKGKFSYTIFDLSSGWRTKESRNPNHVFHQLIREKNTKYEKIDIFTDGSKFLGKKGENAVDCVILIPKLNLSWFYKLNIYTSLFMAEAQALDKALELIKVHNWHG